MTRFTLISLGSVLVLLAGCQGHESATDTPAGPSFAKGGNGRPNIPPTPLRVTFGQGSGGTDAVRADCADSATCPYVHGELGVDAHLNGPTGNLRFGTGTIDGSPIRWFFVTSDVFSGQTRAGPGNPAGDWDNPGGDSSFGFKGIVPGSTATVSVGVGLPRVDTGHNTPEDLRWGLDCQNNPVQASRVSVTRSLDGQSWLVSASSGIHCRKTGTRTRDPFVQIGIAGPFTMTVVNIGDPLPWPYNP